MKTIFAKKPGKAGGPGVLILLALVLFSGAGGDETVYVTASGKKYHREDCAALSRSRIAVTLEDAARSGYGDCSLCKPPVFTAGPAERSGGPALYRVNTAGLAVSSAGETGRMLRAEVVDHVDGDTLRVRIPGPPEGIGAVETVRFLGVDTPETVHPNRPVQRFGKEASEFTRDRLLGKTVYLAFDWDLRDRYGRLLAYLYTAEGRCFNALLVREGYAHAYLRYPFQFMDEFKALEQEARREKRGLWN
jgi:micrococcal nuclease